MLDAFLYERTHYYSFFVFRFNFFCYCSFLNNEADLIFFMLTCELKKNRIGFSRAFTCIGIVLILSLFSGILTIPMTEAGVGHRSSVESITAAKTMSGSATLVILTTDSAGKPLKGVGIWNPLNTVTGQFVKDAGGLTNSAGIWTIAGLEPANYNIVASGGNNYGTIGVYVKLIEGEQKTLTFVMQPQGFITGKVKYTNGTAVVGCYVDAGTESNAYGYVSHSDANGNYIITNLVAGTYEVRALIPGGDGSGDSEDWISVRGVQVSVDKTTSGVDLIITQNAPPPPTNLRFNVTLTGADFKWAFPKGNGGSPITSVTLYIVDVDTGSTRTSSGPRNMNWYSGFSFDFVGGHNYEAYVTSTNVVGESEPSNKVNFKALFPPGSIEKISVKTGNSYVYLNWTTPDSGGSPITQYRIRRAASNQVLTDVFATVPGTQNYFNDTTVTNGLTYNYDVHPVNKLGSTWGSNVVSGTPGVPAPPQNLRSISSGLDGVKFEWNPSEVTGGNILGYRIYTGSIGKTLLKEVPWNVTTYTDYNVTYGVRYFYNVKAYNLYGESSPSNAIDAQMPPSPPQNLKAKGGNGFVYLTWIAPNMKTLVDSYTILRKGGNELEWTQIGSSPGANNFFNDTNEGNHNGPLNNTDYQYCVTASVYYAESARSNVVNTRTGITLLRVVIKDSNGIALQGAGISSTNQPYGQKLLDSSTGADGTLIFANILPGSYTVNAQKTKYISSSGTVVVEECKSAEILIALSLAPTKGSVKLTVKDSAGASISGCSLSSTTQPEGQAVLSIVSSTEGITTFNELTPGRYTFQVTKNGYLTNNGSGTVVAGSTTDINMTLQAQQTGIPGFPLESMMLGILIFTAWLWVNVRKDSL
jgi:hypothetical protein